MRLGMAALVPHDRFDEALVQVLVLGALRVELHPPGGAVPAVARQAAEQRLLGLVVCSLQLIGTACGITELLPQLLQLLLVRVELG